jgi:hypothetical protein
MPVENSAKSRFICYLNYRTVVSFPVFLVFISSPFHTSVLSPFIFRSRGRVHSTPASSSWYLDPETIVTETLRALSQSLQEIDKATYDQATTVYFHILSD